MEKLYPEAIERIADGARYSVSFITRSLRLNGKYIIKDGVYDGDLGVDFTDDPIGHIEYLYDRYRHSIPSERHDMRRRYHFSKAILTDKMDDEDMLYGVPREIATAELEIFMLLAIMTEAISWKTFTDNDPRATWFWKSSKEPSLIIHKKWFDFKSVSECNSSWKPLRTETNKTKQNDKSEQN